MGEILVHVVGLLAFALVGIDWTATRGVACWRGRIEPSIPDPESGDQIPHPALCARNLDLKR